MKRRFLPVLILLFATPFWPKAFAQSPRPEIKPGKNSVVIRGRRQKLYFYPGAGAAPHHKILFAPGDGGHRGFAIKIAENLARMGYDGLIAISLGKTNILGWRWVDNFTYLTGKTPNEPTFQSDEYLPKIAPLPVFVIQSSNDQFIPTEEAEALFVTTKRPKRFTLIHANNHSFESNRDGFFAALQQGMQWIKQREAHHAGQTGVCSSKIEAVKVARTLARVHCLNNLVIFRMNKT